MKQYHVIFEFDIKSSQKDIKDMYAGEVDPTDKQLFDMHRQHVDEVIKTIYDQTGYRMIVKSFEEIHNE